MRKHIENLTPAERKSEQKKEVLPITPHRGTAKRPLKNAKGSTKTQWCLSLQQRFLSQKFGGFR